MAITARRPPFGAPRRRTFLNASLLLVLSGCSSEEPGVKIAPSGGSSGALGGNGGAAGGAGGSAGATRPPPSSGGTGVIDVPVGTAGAASGCVNLECRVAVCDANVTTSVSGTIYDPSGTLPLYNVMVYVPNAPVEPLVPGAACDRCAVSGSPIAAAITDTHGKFTLKNVPAGADVPLVIQVGKWRRQITIPSVSSCAENVLTDVDKLRLPRNRTEGDMPRIALSTGGYDALECLLPKLGISPSEFTLPDGGGSVNLFAGDPLLRRRGTNRYVPTMNGGAQMPPSSSFWSSVDTLKPYDVVLLSCEGDQNERPKGQAAFQAMHDYANLGGRVFASHWHQVWFQEGPEPFPDVATFVDEEDPVDQSVNVDTTFPKGIALADWLVNVQGSTERGFIPITAMQHTVAEVNATLAQRWIYSTMPQSVQYLSANTPMGVPAEQQCGRVVLSDIHVSGREGVGDASSEDLPFPSGCTTMGLSPQEKVLAFMLFDLSACLIPDREPPKPPIVEDPR